MVVKDLPIFPPGGHLKIPPGLIDRRAHARPFLDAVGKGAGRYEAVPCHPEQSNGA
jgi:hypothetical protein